MGSLYRPKYRDSDGTLKESAVIRNPAIDLIDDQLIRAAAAEPRDADPSLIQSQGAPRVPKVGR